MSDTPLVDSVITGTAIEPHHAPRLQNFARELERENATIRADNAELITFLKRLRDEPSLLKSPRAGGQDQYAGMPPAYRIIDHLLSKRKQ